MKKKPELVKSVELDELVELLGRYRTLDVGEAVKSEAEKLITKYGLLPNDALIAATCKHHGISKIATSDPDFKRVDFLEIIEAVPQFILLMMLRVKHCTKAKKVPEFQMPNWQLNSQSYLRPLLFQQS